ncbi:hypothetical protein AVEN_89075-1 [Araneus ventricosus]|uniref:Uncharacterized protein n=1 Tax=Araneus ventricosus TaxID=182803 RepID=A0A4Y2B2F4_ARAVE|nr:hypothetical protein AVEN_89075-1 [Araneus ventricosus]
MSRKIALGICLRCANFRVKNISCCHEGKVRLPNLTEAPDLFKELFCSNSQEAKDYRQQIREYNAALAFASMGAISYDRLTLLLHVLNKSLNIFLQNQQF